MENNVQGLLFFILLGLCCAYQHKLRLDEDEFAAYFGQSTKDAEIVPEHEIVYIDHMTSAKTTRHVTRDSIVGESVSFKLRAFDEDLHAELIKDSDFFAEQTTSCLYLPETGTETVERIPTGCFYRGNVLGHMKSSVSINTCAGITGTISRHGKEDLYIEPLKEAHATKRAMQDGLGHVVYKAPREEQWECGVKDGEHDLGYNIHTDVTEYQTGSSQKYLKLHIVADHQYYTENGADSCKCLTASFHALVHRMALLPNLNLLLSRITIMKTSAILDTNLVSGHNLGLIRTWVDQHPEKANWDLVALVVPKYMDYAGLAYVCSACGYNKVSVSYLGAMYGVQTVAHEMGHNLCINHDTGGYNCGRHGYVMGAAGWSSQEMGWSQCSIQRYLQKVNSHSCLNDS